MFCCWLQVVSFYNWFLVLQNLCLSEPNWIPTLCCVLFVCSVLWNVRTEHLLVLIKCVIQLLPVFWFTVIDTVLPPFKIIFISVVSTFFGLYILANRRVDKYGVLLGLLLSLQRNFKKPTLRYTWTVNYLILIARNIATYLEKGVRSYQQPDRPFYYHVLKYSSF
jgi:hypothetical protein